MAYSPPSRNTTSDNFKMSDMTLEDYGSFLLFGEIDHEISYYTVEFLLKANLAPNRYNPLTIFINSYGGDCADGFGIADMIQSSRLPVSTVGVGKIQSAALLIFVSGTSGFRKIFKHCEIMAHQFYSAPEGKYHDLVAAHKYNSLLEKQFIAHFLKYSTMTERQIKDILFGPSDRWLTPNEMLKYGLCDVVIDQLEAISESKPQEPVGSVSAQFPPRRRKPD